MSHADARLVAAIEEQTATPDDPGQGRLVAELVRRSLDRSGMFEVRRFPAQLQPLAPLAGPLAAGRDRDLHLPGQRDDRQAGADSGRRARRSSARSSPTSAWPASCEGAAKTIQELLQGKAGVFGISPEAYAVLTGPPPAGASPTPSFVLNPVDLAPQLFVARMTRHAPRSLPPRRCCSPLAGAARGRLLRQRPVGAGGLASSAASAARTGSGSTG